ncbi:MAG: hypothetical protein DESF_02067 [Desulfovibrio sp.]
MHDAAVFTRTPFGQRLRLILPWGRTSARIAARTFSSWNCSIWTCRRAGVKPSLRRRREARLLPVPRQSHASASTQPIRTRPSPRLVQVSFLPGCSAQSGGRPFLPSAPAPVPARKTKFCDRRPGMPERRSFRQCRHERLSRYLCVELRLLFRSSTIRVHSLHKRLVLLDIPSKFI